MMNRIEWRRWMAEKEEIIKKSNQEKRKLVQVHYFIFLYQYITAVMKSQFYHLQENQNLRTALDASSEHVFNLLQDASEKIENLRIDLENSHTEIHKLKVVHFTSLFHISSISNFVIIIIGRIINVL